MAQLGRSSALQAGPSSAAPARQASALGPQALPPLPRIDHAVARAHTSPAVKRIGTDADVQAWIHSTAHQNLNLFVARLCEAAVGKSTRAWEKSAVKNHEQDPIDGVGRLLDTFQDWAQDIEPLKEPQRFGNLAFRSWGQRLEENIARLHSELLPAHLQPFSEELSAYLLGAFGSWTRLDYGSGHELSFAAWLCFLARLSLFDEQGQGTASDGIGQWPPDKVEERLALEVFPKYLEVAWTLQDRYGLEPAGSHGVWGLDDYQFIPYAIGAAQLRAQTDYKPLDYSNTSHKPDKSAMQPRQLLQFIAPQSAATRMGGSNALRGLSATGPPPTASNGPPFANLFTSSIARIHSLKRGPFSEHSPILYDVSTTVPHWVKVHQGMMKMWQAECLHKRPVVQHFPFGGVGFPWEGEMGRDTLGKHSENAIRSDPASSTAMAPTAAPWAVSSASSASSRAALPSMEPTGASWAQTQMASSTLGSTAPGAIPIRKPPGPS